MFEDRKLRLLNEKLNLLMTKQSKLAQMGNVSEANVVLNEINQTLAKINMISNKKYDNVRTRFDNAINKNDRKLDILTDKIDKNLSNNNFMPSSKEEDEEAEALLAQIMQNNGRSR